MKQKRKQSLMPASVKSEGQFTNPDAKKSSNNPQNDRESEEARKDMEYSRRFIRKSEEVAGAGKLVYVTRKHHELINVIVHALGEGNMNIFSYIKNVLDEHFDKEKDSIKRLYEEYCNRNIL